MCYLNVQTPITIENAYWLFVIAKWTEKSFFFFNLNDALPSHGGETPSEGLTKSSCGIETW
jgi:hypothetical protein